jgi:hypothetical protein
LLILDADAGDIANDLADDLAGTDEHALGVGCNMAQAFEIQKGDRRAHRGSSAGGPGMSLAKHQQRISRSPLPVRSADGIGTSNMGPPPDRRKRIDPRWRNPPTGPIPGSAIRNKINRFWQI